MRKTIIPCLALGFAACAANVPQLSPQVAALTPDLGRFDVDHSITVSLPEGTHDVSVWFPLPREEPEQELANLRIEAPDGWRQTTDRNGNRYVYCQVASATGKLTLRTRFEVVRREQNVAVDPSRTRPLTDAERAQFAADLKSDRYVVIDEPIRKLAAEICGSEDNPVRVARKLYDWTLDNVEYWVKDPSRWKASPVGSSEYCLTSRTGNCTDFHSLWTALARARGIPTRMEYGSIFKPALNGVDRDASYHCWPEFYAPGIGWVPHDVAVADIFNGPITLDANNTEKVALTTASGYEGPSTAWVEYYFGNLDARRVAWTMGRDLTLEPPQQGGPVNAVAKGYVEVDGKEFTGWERKMTYRELAAQ